MESSSFPTVLLMGNLAQARLVLAYKEVPGTKRVRLLGTTG
jgi:hypothetical protein